METPVVRDHVAELASSMAQRRGDFDLLRGSCKDVSFMYSFYLSEKLVSLQPGRL